MKSRILAFDLDDTLCYRDTDKTGVAKYHDCKPLLEPISIVNQCYDDGDTIIIYTARGMCTFNGDVNKIYSNLYELTVNQLNRWNIKFHQLVMGKLHYDLLIDDKAINSFKVKQKGDLKIEQ